MVQKLGIILLAAFLAGDARAQAPAQLSYQGYLTDAGGIPVNRTVQLTLNLYDSTDGNEPLWTEVQESVAVSAGLFEVRMGSVEPLNISDEVLSAALASGDLFLGVQVDDDVEMEPRQRLLSVPWAWRASNATDALTVGKQAPSSFASSVHTHEGYDITSSVHECDESHDLVCDGCVSTTDLADGSITLADMAPNGCAAGQTFLWNGTAWACGSAQLPADVLDGLAFDPRFVNSSGDTLAGGLAIAPPTGTPAFLTLTGTGAGGEAAVVLEGAGGAWVVSADDETNLFGIYGGGAPRLLIDSLGAVASTGSLEAQGYFRSASLSGWQINPDAGSGHDLLFSPRARGDSDPAMVLTGDGRLGIGTTSPRRPIHFATSSMLLESPATDGDAQFVFSRGPVVGDPDMYLTYWGQLDRNTLALTNDSGDGLHVTTDGRAVVGSFAAGNFSGTARLAVMDGSLGVGTTTPQAFLDVHDQDSVGDFMDVVSLGTGGATYAYKLRHFGGTTRQTDRLDLTTHDNNLLVSFRADGAVGIGTTQPDGQLHVASSGLAQISLESTSSSGGHRWQFQSREDGVLGIGDSTVATNRIVVDQVGNVGVGTGLSAASTTGARLVVGGGIEAALPGGNAYLALLPSSGGTTRIQTGGSSPATDVVIAPAGAEALRVTTSSGTQVQGDLYVNATGSMGGSITAAGNIYAHSTLRIGDVAEEFALAPGENAEAGDVLAIDEEHPGLLHRSRSAYDPKVVGVVSDQPTFRIGVKGGGVPVALVGRAEVKVVGAVSPGDFLVASDTLGVAMRAQDATRGGVIGTAMTGATNGGRVVAFVHVQPVPATGSREIVAQVAELRKRVSRLEARNPDTRATSELRAEPVLASTCVVALLGVALALGSRKRS